MVSKVVPSLSRDSRSRSPHQLLSWRAINLAAVFVTARDLRAMPAGLQRAASLHASLTLSMDNGARSNLYPIRCYRLQLGLPSHLNWHTRDKLSGGQFKSNKRIPRFHREKRVISALNWLSL